MARRLVCRFVSVVVVLVASAGIALAFGGNDLLRIASASTRRALCGAAFISQGWTAGSSTAGAIRSATRISSRVRAQEMAGRSQAYSLRQQPVPD